MGPLANKTVINGFLLTVPGIATFFAVIFALAGLIAYEIFRLQDAYTHTRVTYWYPMYSFHEVNMIASFITSFLLFLLSIVHMCISTKIKATVIKIGMLVHAIIWTILLMVSSSTMVTRSWNTFYLNNRLVELKTVEASGVCGLCEMGCFLTVTVMLILDRFNVVKTNAYQTS